MKFTEIKYTERKNNGNYEHSELTVSAILSEEDNAEYQVTILKRFVGDALASELRAKKIEELEEKVEIENEKKEKRAKAKKQKETKSEVDSSNIPPVIPEEVKEEKPKASKLVKYDSNVAEHKSILGGYLAKKYDTKWRTVGTPEEIKRFTSSLNGQDFLDDKGNMVPSFVEQLSTFFGA